MWLAKGQAELLPVEYFHGFTPCRPSSSEQATICVCWASVSFTQSGLAEPVLKLVPQSTRGYQHSSRAREIFEFVATTASHKECRVDDVGFESLENFNEKRAGWFQ